MGWLYDVSYYIVSRCSCYLLRISNVYRWRLVIHVPRTLLENSAGDLVSVRINDIKIMIAIQGGTHHKTAIFMDDETRLFSVRAITELDVDIEFIETCSTVLNNPSDHIPKSMKV